ncbi:hypothetical protein OO013_00770 [Mangrovivirga sp. M17]|uniref:Uncharacterized protein n=1 Tax=Mangrovivirga halotolerans TaxID=2993936 RepID=A0ABT3RM66_9BACT|nr:hypothetical protein [Mangrovivirga halotolerans]MCX2742372.1 hypothetical protein [Mangrovivirga halotolerans]
MKPKIYILESASVDGELGTDTKELATNKCECGIIRPLIPKFIKVEYIFDTWEGSDVLAGSKSFFVSERLKNEMINDGIKSVEFLKIEASKREYFEIDSSVQKNTLPDFYYLDVLNKNIYCVSKIYNEIECNKCGLKKWELKDNGLDALIKGVTGEGSEESLKIKYDSWKGEDIFYCEMHNKPIITEQFLSCIKKFDIGNLKLGNASWI